MPRRLRCVKCGGKIPPSTTDSAMVGIFVDDELRFGPVHVFACPGQEPDEFSKIHQDGIASVLISLNPVPDDLSSLS